MTKVPTSEIFQIIDSTLDSNDNKLSVSMLCNIAGVSRSGYYNWRNNEEIRYLKEIKDEEDFKLILEAYNFRGDSKGVRGIYMRLLKMGSPMNPKKIRRLMRKYNLFCPIRKANPYRRMQKAMKTSNYAANLLNRKFEAYGPRVVLLTDISYIPYNNTFAYLSVIIDAYTKEVLAYKLSPSLEVEFVLDTVNMLINNHGNEQIGNIGIGDIPQNLEKFGAMNRYPANINLNDPNLDKEDLKNLIFNENQNVVEEKSNKFLSFLDKYKESFGKYFNVELEDIKQKIKGSLIPLNKSFYQSIDIEADLYGPFWILTTIIFLISLIGNFSSYIYAEDKEKFVYDYNHVPHAILIIYGFGFGAPNPKP